MKWFYYILIALAIALVLIYVFEKFIKSPAKKDSSDRSYKGTVADELKREKILRIVKYLIIYSFLTVMGVIIIIPFYWMLITSLKSSTEVVYPKPTYFPEKIIWGNYIEAMQFANFARFMFNTIVVGVFSTLGTLVTTVLAAFAFARLRFKGRDTVFMILLATMMIPGEMMVITNYITIRRDLGWYNTYLAMIVPFWVTVFYIFLLRQSFKQIPDELYYAAKVDGTTDFKYLLRVMIPVGMPTIITITILKLMGAWNSYIWPNLVTEGDMRLITNGLRTAFTDAQGRSSQHLQMAATTVVTIPLLLVFIFLRKYIMRGVSRSGIKG